MSQLKQLMEQCKYRKLNLSSGNTILTYNSSNKVHTRGVIIQFPVIDHNNEQNSYNPSIPFDLKFYGQQLYRKSNFRAVKALMKTYEENRRRTSQDCMNMVGLDIKKINYIPQGKSIEKMQKKSTSGLSRIPTKPKNLSPKARNLSSRSQNNRKVSEQSESLTKDNQGSNTIIKLQITQSAFLNRKKASELLAYPTINKLKPKSKYLYQKLVGTQNNVRQQTNYIYDRRIKSFTDFLFKLQYAHNIYINLDLKSEDINYRSKRVKYFIGPGNNCTMIKGLLKRRYWWVASEDRSQCSFVWTQIKINSIFQLQKKAPKAQITYKEQIQEQQEMVQERQTKKGSLIKREVSPKRGKQTNLQTFNSKLLNQQDESTYKKYLNRYQIDKQRTYAFKVQKLLKNLTSIQSEQFLIHNHLQNNFYLGNKKALFYNLKQYYQLIGQNVFDYVPLTFHIKKGFKDPQYKRFISYYNRRNIQIKKEQKKEQQQGIQQKKKTRNIWIVKPGQNSNQGRGIVVIDQIYQLNSIIKKIGQNNNKSSQLTSRTSLNSTGMGSHTIFQDDKEDSRTYIVQLYIDRPMLYNNRKFDIRHYMLITNLFGVTRAYWYAQGYIRTSSYQFNISVFEPQIHLTNDAVQKKYPQYGRYEPYNKVSYEQFQRYLDSAFFGKKYDFKKQILPKMKKMATDAARSVYNKIAPKNQMNNFEIFGLDFMIDKNFRPWLIQINTNPCLDCVCPLLDRIIPYMVQQSFKLTLDVVYPPPAHYPNTCKHFAPMINLQTFKYELIFDSQTQGQPLKNLYKKVKSNLIAQIGEIEEDQEFKDDGKQIKLDDFT